MTADDTDEHVPRKERRDKDDQGELSPGADHGDGELSSGSGPAKGTPSTEIADSSNMPEAHAEAPDASPSSSGAATTGAEQAETEGKKDDGTPVMHFDDGTGIMSYLLGRHDHVPSYECSCCGTVIEFEASRCPICGNVLGKCDEGIVQLVADKDFDTDPDCSVDCPSCGERVELRKGRCPACMEVVGVYGTMDSAPKVDPVLRAENVVFLHLDVRSGEVSYLQKLSSRPWFEQASVQIPAVDTPDGTKSSRSRTEA